jgi:hypothetical protein
VILTSRELAIVVWLVIFFVWALTKKSVRSSIGSLLTILFSPRLLTLLAIIIGYNIAIVWGLWRVGYWDATMIYDTIVFILVGGIGSVTRAASQGVTYNSRFFFKTILVNLEVMVLFAFLSDFFPFSFWVEFLLIIPFITILLMLIVVAGYQKGSEQVHRFLSGVQLLIGFLLIAYVVWQVVINFGQLMQVQVLFSLGLPFVMSFFFIPILFLACTLFAYEDAFRFITLRVSNDTRLARWKKWRLFLRFGLNLNALQAFRRSPSIHEYSWLKTKEEARVLLKGWSGKSADHHD